MPFSGICVVALIQVMWDINVFNLKVDNFLFDTNIEYMYVPFGKSVHDVTFRLILYVRADSGPTLIPCKNYAALTILHVIYLLYGIDRQQWQVIPNVL